MGRLADVAVGVPPWCALHRANGYATATLATSKGRLMRCTVDGLTPNRSAMTRSGGILPHCCRLTEPSSERHVLQPKREQRLCNDGGRAPNGELASSRASKALGLHQNA